MKRFASALPTTTNSFTVESILSYPYPLNLTSGGDGRTVAYSLDERGVRNGCEWIKRQPII